MPHQEADCEVHRAFKGHDAAPPFFLPIANKALCLHGFCHINQIMRIRIL
jgi:hypothetical protein